MARGKNWRSFLSQMIELSLHKIRGTGTTLASLYLMVCKRLTQEVYAPVSGVGKWTQMKLFMKKIMIK